MLKKIRHYLLGKPLATKAIANERLSNSQGLAIFASDALSSTAYSTEEILLVLVGGGLGTLYFSIPISILIGLLILLVSFSYHQVIHAYPQGGGVYNVASKNLGELPALIGASSLLISSVCVRKRTATFLARHTCGRVMHSHCAAPEPLHPGPSFGRIADFGRKLLQNSSRVST